MCVVIILQGMHEHFPLIVFHGRDEFLERPTLPVAVRERDDFVFVCGLDAVAKGTWAGANCATGRAVFLTNYRTTDLPSEKPLKSRGILVMNLLEMQPQVDMQEYGLCNVVVMNLFSPLEPIVHENNALGEKSALKPGVVHALSNSVRGKEDRKLWGVCILKKKRRWMICLGQKLNFSSARLPS